jgi:hypothetical protein
MPHGRVRVVTLSMAAAMALAGGLAACGNRSSDSASTASRAQFCRAFEQLGSNVNPQHAADELSAVGTPADISSSARHGFDVLVAHLRDLPTNGRPGNVSTMVRNLHTQDAAAVRAFVTYYAGECEGSPSS